MGLTIREAREGDVGAIREIFHAIYGDDYPYQQFYDERWLLRSVFTDDIVMLVACDEATGDVLGSASVVTDIGAHTDLIGEFGRLVVHPNARGRGVGSALMQGRIEAVEGRLHVAIVENRCVHPFSQKISAKNGFQCVGFLPMKHRFISRESISLWCRLFGHARELRRNHPRVVPEAHGLAHLALHRCGFAADLIVDESAPAYRSERTYDIEQMSSEGLPSLMRIERGRVRNREIFGPMRLQYGFFKLQARQAQYLIAREPGTHAVAGAIGFVWDPVDRAVKVFEMIGGSDDVVRPLWDALDVECAGLGCEYIEVDVSAHAPQMQRTLVELGYLPIAYVPCGAFHHTERLDLVKMARLRVPLDLGELALVDEAAAVAGLVVERFASKMVLPRVAAALPDLTLFHGLDESQTVRVAGVCSVEQFADGEALFAAGAKSEEMFLLLEGEVEVRKGERVLGVVGAGDVVGELALITGKPHSAGAHAVGEVSAALISRDDLDELSRLRPDIAVVLYRNAAIALGEKLRGTASD